MTKPKLKGKVNYRYLRISGELPLMLAAHFSLRSKRGSRRTLIINPCLIGDFISSVHALRHYINTHSASPDLVVSPAVKPLAERIRGIGSVFTDAELLASGKLGREYGTIIMMRANSKALSFVRRARARKVETSLMLMIKYALHLADSMARRKTPKQWREVNFEMIHASNRSLSFNNVFSFTEKDHADVRKLDALKTRDRIILVHTESEWVMNRWDNRKWRLLLARINKLDGFRIVFIGGLGAKRDYEIIRRSMDFPVYSLIGAVNLRELALVMRRSDYFIGVDSGPRNLAHLAGLRTIGLLGPGPHMFMPLSDKDIVLDKSDGRGLYERFFYRKDGLMNKISVNDVYNAFLRLHSAAQRPVRRKIR